MLCYVMLYLSLVITVKANLLLCDVITIGASNRLREQCVYFCEHEQ